MTWHSVQESMGFRLLDYRYPVGAVLRVAQTNIRLNLSCKSHKKLRDKVSEIRSRYPSRDIYITVPSKITASWQPKQ